MKEFIVKLRILARAEMTLFKADAQRRSNELVLTLVSYPFVYLPVSAALRRLDPAQEEVSRSLGRGAVRTVFSVTLPQVRTAAAAGGLAHA